MERIINWHEKVLQLKWLMTALIAVTMFLQSNAQNCNLPNGLPESLAQRDEFNFEIAYCFAPHVHHLISGEWVNHGLNGIGDLMTSVFYDGDLSTDNNWDNLENYIDNPNTQEALEPIVYYSVTWSEDYWYIIYAFYHARDFALDIELSDELSCEADEHHSDMEGLILKVKRPTENESAYIEASKSGCHHGYDERPIFEDWGEEIPIQLVDGTHPVITIDNASHCVMHDYLEQIPDGLNPCAPYAESYLDYVPSLTGASIDIDNHTGQYVLEDIHQSGGLWSLRNNEQVFFTWGKFPNTINNVFAKAPWEWVEGGLITDDPQKFFIDMCHDQSLLQINQYISDDIPLEEGPCVPPVDFLPETITITTYVLEGADAQINLGSYSNLLAENHIQFQETPPFGVLLSGNILTIRNVEEACYEFEMEAVTACKIELFTLKINVRINDGPWYPHSLDGPPKFIIKPNPVIHNLTLEFIEPSFDDDQYDYFIFSEQGVLLDKGTQENDDINIETSTLNSDSYYLMIKTDSFIQSQSFIKI